DAAGEDTIVGQIEVATLDIGLNAEHPVRCRLPVIADLPTAVDTVEGLMKTVGPAVEGSTCANDREPSTAENGFTARIIVADAVAEVNTAIEPRPIHGHDRSRSRFHRQIRGECRSR